eukprot:5122814-Pyramimonas_sp.AAC.1
MMLHCMACFLSYVCGAKCNPSSGGETTPATPTPYFKGMGANKGTRHACYATSRRVNPREPKS